jgi:hypothetical protein
MKKVSFAVLMLTLPSCAALAGPRDDVVQGIVRCGTIADDRQWLDCIYGAAQPMRAQLGLSPAPAAQQRLVPQQGYGTLPGYGPGYGGAPAPVPAAPLPPRSAYAPVPVPAAPVRAASAAPAQPPEYFTKKEPRDFFDRMLGTANIPTVVTRMTSYEFDKQGLFTVSLSNGQSWRQMPDTGQPARFTKPAQAYTVQVKPGAFGSYNLVVNDEPRIYKVKRVK